MSATSDKAISKKVTVLLSGGIDSTVLGYTLIESGAEVSGVYVNFGHPAYLKGRVAINAFVQRTRIPVEALEVPRISEIFIGTGDDGTGWIWAKLYLIVTLAALWANSVGCDALAVALNKNDFERLKSVGDDPEKIIKHLEAAIVEMRKGRKFEIAMPIKDLSKADVVSRALAMKCP